MEEGTITAEKLVNTLEAKGEISINDGFNSIFIQTIDDKEGYAYVSSTNKEFKDSKEAVEWAIKKMNGIYNIKTCK